MGTDQQKTAQRMGLHSLSMFFIWGLLFTLGCTGLGPESDAETIVAIKEAKARQALGLHLDAVTVTYVRTAGIDPINDPAGFALQAQNGGPALFLPLGPEELQPYPKPGDVVRMNIVEILEPGMSLTGALWHPEDGAFVPPSALSNAMAHWKLEGNGADERGPTYKATLRDVRTIYGRIDKYAVAFDGDQSIALTNAALNFPTESFTVSFWVKRRGEQLAYTGILGNLSETGGWGVDFEHEQGHAIRLSTRGENTWGGGTQSISLRNGVWEHVVFTRQGDFIQGYLNGTKVMTDTARPRLGPAMVKFSFGGFGTNPRFRGSLDDIAIWKRALSDTEISGLYQGPTTPRSWFASEDIEQLKEYLDKNDPQMSRRMSGAFNGRIVLTDVQILGQTRREPVVHDLSASEGLLEQSETLHDQLVRITATIQGPLVGHGPGFVSGDLQTDIQNTLQRIRLRLPQALALQHNLREGCRIRTLPTPLRFYRDTPIISIVDASELEVVSCPKDSETAQGKPPSDANDLVLSELMPRPDKDNSPPLQWFELFNTHTEDTFTLRGCSFDFGGERNPVVVRDAIQIPPRSYLLIKTSHTPTSSPKGAVIAPAFNMIGDDQKAEISLRCNDTLIATVRLPLREEIGKSYAMQTQTTDGKRRWCVSPSIYTQPRDTPPLYGTPGTKNDCP